MWNDGVRLQNTDTQQLQKFVQNNECYAFKQSFLSKLSNTSCLGTLAPVPKTVCHELHPIYIKDIITFYYYLVLNLVKYTVIIQNLQGN